MAMFETLNSMVGMLGNTIILILIAVIFCAMLIGIVYLFLRQKRFKKYKLLIFKRKTDSEGRETLVFCDIDKGAVLMDKKLKRRYLVMKKANFRLGEEERSDFDENRDLNIPSIPSEQGGEIVFLEKLAPRKYAIGQPIMFSGKAKIIISDADCAEAIRQYDLNAKYYGGSDMAKWIGPISFAVFAVLIVILISVIMNKFDVLKEVSENLMRASEVLAQGRNSAIATSVT